MIARCFLAVIVMLIAVGCTYKTYHHDPVVTREIIDEGVVTEEHFVVE